MGRPSFSRRAIFRWNARLASSSAFGCARCSCQFGLNHKTVAVFHQRMADVTKTALLAVPLAEQSRIRIGAAFLGLVGALLAAKVAHSIAARTRIIISAILAPGAIPIIRSRLVRRERISFSAR